MNRTYIFLIFIILLFGILPDLFCQVYLDKGYYNISGSLSYSRTSYKNIKVTNKKINLTPEFNYLITPRLSLGIFLDYFRESEEEYKRSIAGIGPNIKYYFGSSKIIPFIGLNYMIYSTSIEMPDKSETDISDFAISGGIDFFLSQNVALEPSVKYINMNEEAKDGNVNFIEGLDSVKRNIIQIAVGLSIFLN